MIFPKWGETSIGLGEPSSSHELEGTGQGVTMYRGVITEPELRLRRMRNRYEANNFSV
jgi:hypothetical protein